MFGLAVEVNGNHYFMYIPDQLEDHIDVDSLEGIHRYYEGEKTDLDTIWPKFKMELLMVLSVANLTKNLDVPRYRIYFGEDGVCNVHVCKHEIPQELLDFINNDETE